MVTFFRSAEPPPPAVVLLISDDDQTLTHLAQDLQAAGCKVHQARDVETALMLLDTLPMPDVLIGDFRDPETDGTAFLHRARLRFGRRGLPPTLFLLDTPEDEIVARRCEVEDVLAKPVDVQALVASLNRLLDGKTVLTFAPREADDPSDAARASTSVLRRFVPSLGQSDA